MKQVSAISTILLSIFLLSSCAKNEAEIIKPKEDNCTFLSADIIVEPVCSFNPSLFPTIQFPVRILHNGEVVVNPAYMFEWSTDSTFKGSAISINYEMLPLTATVTEVESDCIATAVLTTEYWN